MDRFERLIIAEIPRLRRYARALTGHAVRADDLVQECLLRAITRRSLWATDRPVRPWLLTIMHNLHVNEVKRWHRDQPADLEADDQVTGSNGGLERLALRDLDRALAKVPAEQREIVLLVGVEGLSYKETAEVVGVPIGTVMSRLARGRERLRTLLDPPAREPAGRDGTALPAPGPEGRRV